MKLVKMSGNVEDKCKLMQAMSLKKKKNYQTDKMIKASLL